MKRFFCAGLHRSFTYTRLTSVVQEPAASGGVVDVNSSASRSRRLGHQDLHDANAAALCRTNRELDIRRPCAVTLTVAAV